MRPPTLKFVHSCETSVGSGWSARKFNLDTKIGVSGFKILVFCLVDQCIFEVVKLGNSTSKVNISALGVFFHFRH